MQEQSGQMSIRQMAPLVILVIALSCASYWLTPLVAEKVFKSEHTVDGGVSPCPGYDDIINPKTAIDFYNSANVRYHIGDLNGTIKDCTTSLKLKPDNAEAYFLRGSAYFDDEKKVEALKDLDKAVKLDPKNPEYVFTRGRCYLVSDKPKLAIEDYTTSIHLKNDDPAVWCARAYIHGTQGDAHAAIADLTDAESLDPKDPWIPFQRGNEKVGLKDNQGALEDYNKALKIMPTYATVYYNRGRLLCAMGDKISGHKDLDRAIELDPKDAYAYRVRAQILFEEGNEKIGKIDLKKAEELEQEQDKELKRFKKRRKKKKYELIKDPLVYKFCADTLAQEQKIFGPAKVPVNRLYIYYRTGRSCQTTMVDEKRGVFVICMANDEHVDVYYYSLVHELMHLLNTRIADPFIEGLCSMFVEHTDPPNQRKFKLWSKRYERGVVRLPFYAETYLMCKELDSKLTLDGLSKILKYTNYHTGSKDWIHIDPDAWLASLPEPKKTEARNIIARYSDAIEEDLPLDGAYGFARPAGTKRADGRVIDQWGKDVKDPLNNWRDKKKPKSKEETLRDDNERNLRWPNDNLRPVTPEEGGAIEEKTPQLKPAMPRQT